MTPASLDVTATREAPGFEGRAPLPGERFDAVIVGAGAAGLSLACHLAHAGWGDKVLVVDDGSHAPGARSWAWWSTGIGLLDSAASTEVDHLWVAGTGWRRSMTLDPYAYRRITGPGLSAATDRIIGARPGYQRVVGSVRALAPEGSGCRVVIDLPEPGGVRTVEISARWVFDSVGPGSTPLHPHLRRTWTSSACTSSTRTTRSTLARPR